MNRYMTIPKETFVYITILAVVMVSAMIREINLLIILAGLMIGPLLVNWQVVRLTLGKMSCDRKIPDSLYPNEPFSVDLIVKNGRRRLDSWALVIEDKFRWKGRVASSKKDEVRARAFIPNLKPGKLGMASYRGGLARRGRYEVGPIKISTSVPLGLFKYTIVVPNSGDQIVVYPRLGVVTKRWHELVKVDQMGQRSTRRNQGQIEGDFYGLRDWRTGDSRRWIHWRSSAKRNELVVRQFEQNRNQNFVILLNLQSAQTESVEMAISFVASVVVEHCRRHGGNLILGVGGGQVQFVKGSASNAFIAEALEVLAVATNAVADPMPELIETGMASLSSDDRLVLVSTKPFDTQDVTRFDHVAEDRQKRRAFNQAINVDVTDHEFSKWFHFDETETTQEVPTDVLQNGKGSVTRQVQPQ